MLTMIGRQTWPSPLKEEDVFYFLLFLAKKILLFGTFRDHPIHARAPFLTYFCVSYYSHNIKNYNSIRISSSIFFYNTFKKKKIFFLPQQIKVALYYINFLLWKKRNFILWRKKIFFISWTKKKDGWQNAATLAKWEWNREKRGRGVEKWNERERNSRMENSE